jgi:hypothetical protein
VIISYSGTDNIYCAPVRILMKKYTLVTRRVSVNDLMVMYVESLGGR